MQSIFTLSILLSISYNPIVILHAHYAINLFESSTIFFYPVGAQLSVCHYLLRTKPATSSWLLVSVYFPLLLPLLYIL